MPLNVTARAFSNSNTGFRVENSATKLVAIDCLPFLTVVELARRESILNYKEENESKVDSAVSNMNEEGKGEVEKKDEEKQEKQDNDINSHDFKLYKNLCNFL